MDSFLWPRIIRHISGTSTDLEGHLPCQGHWIDKFKPEQKTTKTHAHTQNVVLWRKWLFWLKFTEICTLGSNWQVVSKGSDNVQATSSRWRHNGHDAVSNHQPHDCLPNRLFRRRSMKTSKLCVTGLCVGNSPMTGEVPTQKACNAESVSIWWRHQLLLLQIMRSRFDLHWNLFQSIQLTISQHWLR